MILNKKLELNTEQDTKNIAINLANICKNKIKDNNYIIYLNGDLGVGKTTFTRYFIQSFGHNGSVKSPTYTLIENYNVDKINIYHLDLYRLADPEEFNFLGLEDMLDKNNNIVLIEWPEKGSSFLPKANLDLRFKYQDKNRSLEIIEHNKRYNGL